MSLQPCRECGHEVSVDAATCPHCGCVNPAREKSGGCTGVFILMIVLLGVAAVVKTVFLPH